MRQLPLAFLCVAVAGCSSQMFGSTIGSGKLSKEVRPLPNFEQLRLVGATDATVVFGDEAKVLLKADDNLLPLIETSVQSGVLRIEFRESVRTTNGIRAEITVPKLTKVELVGSSTLTITGLKAPKFELHSAGASSIVASGQVDELVLQSDGASKADLRTLVAGRASVELNGASTATVHATDAIQGQANGASHLTTVGGANVVVKTNGASNVKPD